MVGIPQALRTAGTTAYGALTSTATQLRNLPTTVSNISVSPSFSRQATVLTESAKEHSQTGNFAMKRFASYEVTVAALAEAKSGVLGTVNTLLEAPVHILRGHLLDAGKDIITALKTAGKTVGFVAASVVLAVAGLIFPGTVFAALNREAAPVAVALAASPAPSEVESDDESSEGSSRASSPAGSVASAEEEVPATQPAPTAREARVAARQASRDAAAALEAAPAAVA